MLTITLREILGNTDLSHLHGDRNQVNRRSLPNVLVPGYFLNSKNHFLVIVTEGGNRNIMTTAARKKHNKKRLFPMKCSGP